MTPMSECSSLTTRELLQSDLSSIENKAVFVNGFYTLGDKCTGSYLVKAADGSEVWGTPFTTDGITLVLSNAGELKAGTAYKLIPLSENGTMNLRLLGLSEKGTVDNAPIFNVGMNAFPDVTINGFFKTRPVKASRANAVYRCVCTLTSFADNQDYIIWVKARSVKILGRLELKANNRRCKNGFIGEDWAGGYIQEIILDSFTYWGLIGRFPYPSNSNAIRIDHSQTNRCGSYLDTTFTTVSRNGGRAVIKLADPLPEGLNTQFIDLQVVKVNQKQTGSITAGSKVLTVVDKTGIRKSEHVVIPGEKDSQGTPIQFTVVDIQDNAIILDKASSSTYSTIEIFLEDHYLPIPDIKSGSELGSSIIDTSTITVDCVDMKGMGASPQGKIRVYYGGGINVEKGNDNNIWDFGTCHNIACPSIAFSQGAMYGHTFHRFEATVCEIAVFTWGGYSSTFGTPYFESNGRNIVVAGNTNFSLYEPVMAEKEIYYCYSDKVDPPSTNVLMVNSGVLYSSDFQHVSYSWPNDMPTLMGGKTYFLTYPRPSTDSATFILKSYSNIMGGRIVKIIIGEDYKSTITFKSGDPAYTVAVNNTYVDLSGCEITAYKDHLSFQWRLFINKTSFTKPAGGSPAPTVTVTPANGSTFTTATTNVYLRPNEHATIYYTLDGSTPTTSSRVYDGPIVISDTTTIKYIAKGLSGSISTVGSATITKPDMIAPIVTISPAPGTYHTDTATITLAANEAATIYYTLDGNTPTTSSAVYSSPITINDTRTIKYFAVDLAGNSSVISTASYIKVVDTTPPSPVTGLVKEDATESTIKVSWTANAVDTDLAGYNVYLNGVKSNTSLITVTNFEFKALTSGTNYLIQATAVDQAGNESAKTGTTASTASVVVSDSFNRADASALGNADTGQTWNVGTSLFAIQANRAQHISGAAPAIINHNLKDFVYYMTLAVEQAGNYFLRYVNNQNYVYLYNAGGKYALGKKIQNVNTTIFISSAADNNGDKIRIIHKSDGTIKAAVNGKVVWEGIETNLLDTFTASGFGGNSAARFDDFKITTL